jgi:uncharacterized protein
MKRILLISDSHGTLGEDVMRHVVAADEVWHAGDWGGGMEVYDQLCATGKTIRGVWGNIDSHDMRKVVPYEQHFTVEGLLVYMIHIGGYPGRYAGGIKEKLVQYRPQVFICGHSHIAKVIRDNAMSLLHMNPGACGFHGFHRVRTMIRMEIAHGSISKADMIELGNR